MEARTERGERTAARRRVTGGGRWALGVASAMVLATLLLAPAVVQFWRAKMLPAAASSVLQRGSSTRSTERPALRPNRGDASAGPRPAPPESRPVRSAPQPKSGGPTPPRARDAGPPSEEPLRAEELDEVPGAPHGQPAGTPHGAAAARADDFAATETAAVPPALADDPVEAAPHPELAEPRRIELATFRVRLEPGLCKESSAALQARDTLAARFLGLAWDDAARLFLDPRLPAGADEPLFSDLERSEREVQRVLGLSPPRPDVFAYFDTELLLAAACTNDDVVAYYDGALHVVASHPDVEQSILHEYSHHALMSAGLLGPAWAQEGIAMHVARESWWRDGRWLDRLIARPFSLAVMESAIPYTLQPEQAALFYVQSAAMVACATREDARGLRGLVDALETAHEHGQLRYALPRSAHPSRWRECFAAAVDD